ncbi:MAG: ImmA/IrrE family metallo-endopeptidase [Actinomycetota bacterium]|nr:ImmA/IrrE family metallo-endopeptidase [Actinomycetota bacterium]
MNRLRAYRALEGISQDELGELLDLSPQMVSAVEGGRRSFTGDLAALGYSNDRFDLPDMSEPLHRQRASTKVTARKRAQELLRLAGEIFQELRGRTDRAPSLSLERLASPRSAEEVEELATEVRFALRQEVSGPIRNLTAAVERAGVCLIPIIGLEGVDGLSSWVDGVPVIGLSPSVPGDRFRLTLGHEVAHLLFHTRRGETTEHEANRFAGALLFPQGEFDALMPPMPQLRDFIGLKSSWGVSVAALVYRAHELDYIDDRRYRALQIQMSKWRKTEPASFSPVHGELTSRLVVANGGLDTVSRELGVNRKHLHEVCNWSHLRVA